MKRGLPHPFLTARLLPAGFSPARGLRALLAAVLLVAAAPFAAGCSEGASDAPETEAQTIRVKFTLAMSRPTSRAATGTETRSATGTETRPETATATGAETRAETWEDYQPSETGDSFDNRIQPNTLSVVIFDPQNGYIGQVEHLIYYPTAVVNEYEFQGDLTASADRLTKDESYKIMVFANLTAEIGAGTDLSELSFERSPTDSQEACIPMWGIATERFDLTPGRCQDLGTIHVLRALAKVTVVLDESVSGSIEQVIVDRCNSEGYALPAGGMQTASTLTLTTEGVLHAKSSPAEQLARYPDAADPRTAVFYLPEYDNCSAGSTPATLSLHLKDDAGTETAYDGVIAFRRYDTDGRAIAGTDYDILRNHHYIFEITDTGGDALRLRATIADLESGGEFEYEY